MVCTHPLHVTLASSLLTGRKYAARIEGPFNGARATTWAAAGDRDPALDLRRTSLYLHRHQAHEVWSEGGLPGFWGRWLPWDKPGRGLSKKEMRQRFCPRLD